MEMVDTLLTSSHNPDEEVAQRLAAVGRRLARPARHGQDLAFHMHSRGQAAGREIAEREMADLLCDYLAERRHKPPQAAEELVADFVAEQPAAGRPDGGTGRPVSLLAPELPGVPGRRAIWPRGEREVDAYRPFHRRCGPAGRLVVARADLADRRLPQHHRAKTRQATWCAGWRYLDDAKCPHTGGCWRRPNWPPPPSWKGATRTATRCALAGRLAELVTGAAVPSGSRTADRPAPAHRSHARHLDRGCASGTPGTGTGRAGPASRRPSAARRCATASSGLYEEVSRLSTTSMYSSAR